MAKYKAMGANSSYKAMYDIVEQAKDGTIFIPDDFTMCGTPDAVRSGLSRLCRNGKLYRFAKGIYYVPLYDKWDGTLREPSLDDIALKLRKETVRVSFRQERMRLTGWGYPHKYRPTLFT